VATTRTTSRTKRSSKKRTSSSKGGARKGTSSKRAKPRKPTKKGTSRTTAKKRATGSRKTKAARGKKAPAKRKAAKTVRKAKPANKARAKKTAAPAKKRPSRAKAAEAVKSTPAASPSHDGGRPTKVPYGEGAFVVHPKYGLGRVERIVDRSLTTRTVRCLEIRFPYQEMKLTIPLDQVDNSGLRPPIGRRQIDGVFKVLKGRATFDANRRSAKRVMDYRKRLSEGDPTSLAEAVRDLGRLSLRKALSYEERRILSTALRILSREVALARGREADDVREEIEKIVYR